MRGQELMITTNYDHEGDSSMIAMSYPKLAQDVKPGNMILCSDGTISLLVLECDTAAGTVKCRCENTASLGERKNVNLPGIIVDLPTFTPRDVEDITVWGIPNRVDFIAASFVRKGSDVVRVKELLGKASSSIHIISKVAPQLKPFQLSVIVPKWCCSLNKTLLTIR
jgi:pyruvate kinase